MPTDPVARLLDENAELRPLAARLAYVRRLQRRYRSLAPQGLAEASRVCAMDGTTVVICADNGAVAAALRHLAPRLLQGLREAARKSQKHARDQELTSIRVEVQVAVPAPKRVVRARGEIPAEKLAGVARGLSQSPLREKLEEMARAQSSRTRPKT